MNRTKKMLTVSFVFVLGCASQLSGQAASEKPGEWQPIEQAIGRSHALLGQ